MLFLCVFFLSRWPVVRWIGETREQIIAVGWGDTLAPRRPDRRYLHGMAYGVVQACKFLTRRDTKLDAIRGSEVT